MEFRRWLERIELDDSYTTGILGIVAEDRPLGDDEKETFLNMNTKDFSNEIQDKLKDFWAVKKSAAEDRSKYDSILKVIEHGITIKDLIEKIKPMDFAPHAEATPLVSPASMPQQSQTFYIEP